jgi:hypothetical protein
MNTTTTAPITTQYLERDKYGRTVQHTTVNGRTVCVRVTLPKAYRAVYGQAYLVNDWSSLDVTTGQTDVTRFATIAQARAQVAGILAREISKA